MISFVIGKLAAYGIDKITIPYIYPYLKNSVNNIKSNFRRNNIRSSRRTKGFLLFIVFFNEFSVLYQLLRHIIAHDNTLSSFAKTIENLKSESEIAISWFEDNHLIMNSGKFQTFFD